MQNLLARGVKIGFESVTLTRLLTEYGVGTATALVEMAEMGLSVSWLLGTLTEFGPAILGLLAKYKRAAGGELAAHRHGYCAMMAKPAGPGGILAEIQEPEHAELRKILARILFEDMENRLDDLVGTDELAMARHQFAALKMAVWK